MVIFQEFNNFPNWFLGRFNAIHDIPFVFRSFLFAFSFQSLFFLLKDISDSTFVSLRVNIELFFTIPGLKFFEFFQPFFGFF